MRAAGMAMLGPAKHHWCRHVQSTKLLDWLLSMLAVTAAGMVSVCSSSYKVSRRTQFLRLLGMPRRWLRMCGQTFILRLCIRGATLPMHIHSQVGGHLENQAKTTGTSRYGRPSPRDSQCSCKSCRSISLSSHAADGCARIPAHRLQTRGSPITPMSNAGARHSPALPC